MNTSNEKKQNDNLAKSSAELVVLKKLKENIAALAAVVGGLSTLAGYLGKQSGDPFFIYYFISALTLCIAIWILFKYCSTKNLITGITVVFILAASLAVFAVLWRYMSIDFFLQSPTKYPRPKGFDHEPSYIPYFFLVAASLLTLVATSLYCTQNTIESNKIRSYFFWSLLILIIWLALCRLTWQFIDSRALSSGLL